MHDEDRLIVEAPSPEDAGPMAEIYNENVARWGVLPQVRRATEPGLRRMIDAHRQAGWPLWVVRHPGGVAAWASLRSTPWWPEVSHRAGDFSVYVTQAWQGRGAAALAIFAAPPHAQRCGFESVICTIMGSNRKSIALARGCGLSRWGLLPRFASYGDRTEDVEIWGCRLDDAGFMARLQRLDARVRARVGDGGAFDRGPAPGAG